MLTRKKARTRFASVRVAIAVLLGFVGLCGPWAAADSPGLELHSGDVVVFIGGTDMVNLRETGYLETLLTVRFADRRLRFRNMAWESDTVYRQKRPINFGDWATELSRVRSSVLFVRFGRVESMQGPEGLERFDGAYRALLDQLGEHADRIVLLTPTPFENPGGALPDLSAHNESLKSYVERIERIAEEGGHGFIDLFDSASGRDVRLTSNGMHLTEEGQRVVAERVVSLLGLVSGVSGDEWARMEPIRHAINEKNRLWFDYWRPANWAFLRGDRTDVPFSYDFEDTSQRLFPKEMEGFPELIERAERLVAYETERAEGLPDEKTN